MDAKEKAKELVEKMFQTGSALYADRVGAKQCALIAVDEIINEIQFMAESDEGLPYWEEVKQEIEKL